MPTLSPTITISELAFDALTERAAATGVTIDDLVHKVITDFANRALDDYETSLNAKLKAFWEVATAEQKRTLIAFLKSQGA
ncbi:MAG TPA: hypothetical protein VEA69_02850 [Tepidisphaeraceae bacterium]|nr:hypothetical protein [Tepidisphaeraceae bacterium]